MVRRNGILGAVICAIGASVFLQANAATENITVHALSSAEVKAAVKAMTPVRPNHQISRWNRPVCPKVYGLNPIFSDIIIQHLQSNARLADVAFNRNCVNPDVYIVASNDGDDVFRKIYQINPTLWQGVDTNGATSLNLDAISAADTDLLRKDRPVRWFRSVGVEMSDGAYVSYLPTGPWKNTPTIETSDVSALNLPTREETKYVFIIIDVSKTGSMTWGALSNYISFVALAQSDMATAFEPFSIMADFENGQYRADAPKTLTPFDIAALKALYASAPNQSPEQERNEMVQNILRSSGR